MIYRFSYSILSCWSRGDYDRAIDMMLRKPFEPTPAMVAGTKLHEEWEAEGRATGCLPAVFGGRRLTDPLFEGETKRELMLNDWLQLVGVLDLKEPTTGIDYKSGVVSANAYSHSHQGNCYNVLFPELTRFEWHAHNQYTKETTMSIRHLTDATLLEGITWILKNGTEIKNYMTSNNLIPVTRAA